MVWTWFRYCSLGSYNSTGPDPVPWFQFLLLDVIPCFWGIISSFLILVLIWLKFSTILVRNQVEPKALVLETKNLEPKLLKNFGTKI